MTQYIGLKDIFEELVKLNRNIDRLLCFQLLEAKRRGYNPVGPGTGTPDVEREGGLRGVSDIPIASDGSACGAPFRPRSLYSRDADSGGNAVRGPGAPIRASVPVSEGVDHHDHPQWEDTA